MSKFDIYGVDSGNFFTKTRTVFLYGEINAAMAYEIGCRLKYLDYVDSNEPITVEINSQGGE
ncbi:MAG: ATP-dependent Clp protease proteolytic subunit, partial [Eubacteriales bacterium]